MTVIRWLSNRDILKIYEIAFQSYLLKLIAHFAPHTLIENKYLIKKNKSHKPKQKINQFIFIKLDLGSIITVDWFKIAKPRILFETARKKSIARKYCNDTIFYDPTSKIIKCYFWASLYGTETVLSKNTYERFMNDTWREVKHYRSDNDILTKQKFMEEVSKI